MDYYSQIKDTLIQCESKVIAKDYTKNKIILESYYYVGKMLSEAGKHYGEGVVKEYSSKLKEEVGKKYNVRYLYDIRKLYLFSKVHPLEAKLTLSHYRLLFSIKDANKVDYYIEEAINRKLSKRELHKIIESNEYERLLDDTKGKIKNKEEIKPLDLIPNPIHIKSKSNINLDNIKEKMLKEYILENIDDFLNELGVGYMYVGSEYKLNIDNRNYHIDILLYNIKYNCYIVVELKVTELKKEHIGQLMFYMNYVDKNIKEETNNETIGLILVKKIMNLY